jgi:hypothetical protein
VTGQRNETARGFSNEANPTVEGQGDVVGSEANPSVPGGAVFGALARAAALQAGYPDWPLVTRWPLEGSDD